MPVIMIPKEHADDIIHGGPAGEFTREVKNHKYIYKEKLSNGKYRYYYKQPEVKGPRGNARISGSRYGNYATKDGNHTLKYVRSDVTDSAGFYEHKPGKGKDFQIVKGHTTLYEGEDVRKAEKAEHKKKIRKIKIEKGKKKISKLFKRG